MSAVVDGPGIILSENWVHGYYNWQVQVPFFVTYTSASSQRQERFIATMNVIRMPTVETRDNQDTIPENLEINNFIISQSGDFLLQ